MTDTLAKEECLPLYGFPSSTRYLNAAMTFAPICVVIRSLIGLNNFPIKPPLISISAFDVNSVLLFTEITDQVFLADFTKGKLNPIVS